MNGGGCDEKDEEGRFSDEEKKRNEKSLLRNLNFFKEQEK